MVHDSGSILKSGHEIRDIALSLSDVKIAEGGKNAVAPEQAVADAIDAQPLLALRLLKLVGFIADPARSPSTVTQCVGILGTDTIKALALGLSAFSLPLGGAGGQSGPGTATLLSLWEHALGCATLAGRFAARLGGIAPPSAFVAGFLHDIGRVLLYHASAKLFIETRELATEKKIPLAEAEILAAGIDHASLGELWAQKAGLDVLLQTAIQHHHTPLCLMPDSVGARPLHILTVVRLADIVSETRYADGCGSVEPATDLWSALKLRPEDWSLEVRRVNQRIISARESFGFGTAETYAHCADQNGMFAEHQDTAAALPLPRVISLSPKPHSGPRGQTHGSKRLTVLVVEDHGALCEMLSLYLMRHGYHVRSADNGQTALQVISKEEIDVVLLDLMLPRVDGFSVLKQVRDGGNRKPYIIVVSAGASEKDRNRVLDLGADEYMPKPFHLTRLLERIRAVEQYLFG